MLMAWTRAGRPAPRGRPASPAGVLVARRAEPAAARQGGMVHHATDHRRARARPGRRCLVGRTRGRRRPDRGAAHGRRERAGRLQQRRRRRSGRRRPRGECRTIVEAGVVNVLYGTAGGLTGSGSQLFTQVGSAAEAYDRFGQALATGDFNHDGFADLAAGAPLEDVGSIADAGAVSVLYGSAGNLTRTGGQIFTQSSPGVPSSAERNDRFGGALAAGGAGASTMSAAP